jgi:2-iminobutanoate/2-iminopropanoate deaminase
MEISASDSSNAIPEAIRVNDTIYAPHLTGADPTTARLPDGLLPQMEAALRNMRAMLERAGASMDNVGRVVGYVTAVADRDPIYEPWDAMFPDAADRPAFKVLVAKLPLGVLVQLSMFALVGARRERIDIPGVPARDPTVKVGNWVFSSRVHGTDPATSTSPESGEAQGELAYGNLLRLIELAGAEPHDIHQVTAFIRDPANAALTERAFQRAFPDAAVRPRHWILDAFIRPQLAVMAELVATRGEAGPGERIGEFFARPESDPIAEAVQLGPIIYAPAISGVEPSTAPATGPALGPAAMSGTGSAPGPAPMSATPSDLASQLRAAIRNLQGLLGRTGTTVGEVAHITVFMPDLADKEALDTVWSELYPDPSDRPPHTSVPAKLPAGELVRLAVIAIPDGNGRPDLQFIDDHGFRSRAR